jgi:hypothetical protein
MIVGMTNLTRGSQPMSEGAKCATIVAVTFAIVGTICGLFITAHQATSSSSPAPRQVEADRSEPKTPYLKVQSEQVDEKSSSGGSSYYRSSDKGSTDADGVNDYSSTTYEKDTYKPAVAENGSYYGEPSKATGNPKTVHVKGYYRKDGTYVRGHYRSKPRR